MSFSDKWLTKKWNLDGFDGFAYYWYDLRKVQRSMFCRQNGCFPVMVRGAVCLNGETFLAFLNGCQKYENIQDTLASFPCIFASSLGKI